MINGTFKSGEQRTDSGMQIRLTFNYWRKGGYNVGSEDYRWSVHPPRAKASMANTISGNGSEGRFQSGLLSS